MGGAHKSRLAKAARCRITERLVARAISFDHIDSRALITLLIADMVQTTVRSNLEQIDVFVSQTIRRYISHAVAGTVDEFQKPFDGAFLFADISGFSGLARRFADRGAEGAEHVIGMINTYFDPLIHILDEHGCDIISFAGDAVLTLLRGDDLTSVAMRAASCGLTITNQLCDFQVAEDVRMSIRVSIGAGKLSTIALGDDINKQMMLVGPPLQQVRIADRHAQPGDVMLAPEVMALLDDQVAAEPVGEAFVLRGIPQPPAALPLSIVDLPAGEERRLREFVPPAVLSRIDFGQTDWLAELRRVSVAFLRLDGLESDKLDCGPALRSATDRIQAITTKFDGSLVHLLADDKGTLAIACFGIPPNGSESQALRAVSATRAIVAHFRDEGTECSAGIATGDMFCGLLGNTQRRCYTVFGDVVNLATRLMQSSEGEVLCDAATHAETMQETRYTRAPNHRIKSYDEPVPVFRARIPGRSPSNLIGRQEALSTLNETISRTMEGVPQTLIIEGEPGIGKSELVGELIRRAAAQSLVTVAGAANNIDRLTPEVDPMRWTTGGLL